MSSISRNLPIVSVLLAVALTGCAAFNPLRRSDDGVQKWLEKITPLGSSLTEVRATAVKRGWYDANMQGSDGRTTGTYIRGELGEYRGFPFVTSVTAFWDFDTSNRLSNIRIWKTVDGF